jgi:hypothetical protein
MCLTALLSFRQEEAVVVARLAGFSKITARSASRHPGRSKIGQPIPGRHVSIA